MGTGEAELSAEMKVAEAPGSEDPTLDHVVKGTIHSLSVFHHVSYCLYIDSVADPAPAIMIQGYICYATYHGDGGGLRWPLGKKLKLKMQGERN